MNLRLLIRLCVVTWLACSPAFAIGQAGTSRANAPLTADAPTTTATSASVPGPLEQAARKQIEQSGPMLVLFALSSFAPAAVLMVTAFVRINIVLTLLRQALGSPQIPGNQVVLALALLLTALVMEPVGRQVYERGIEPYSRQELSAEQAWSAGTGPIKTFMLTQIKKTGHVDYLWKLHDFTVPEGTTVPDPKSLEGFSLRVIAPAYLISELTTAMMIGFLIYLPFLVIDLVVSAVLAAMGLFMLPPSLVALPLKLILFVLADGWMLVAGMLLRSFGT
jgi:flagellar biosynthetic protein FliP